MRLRVLSGEDIERALPMAEAIAAVARAYVEVSRSRVLAPPRASLGTASGVSLVMPAHLPELKALGLKLISIYPGNPARGLPTVHALALLLDPDSGQPLALLNGGRLTALRTGAGSGAATQVLAPAGAKVLALLGAGGQAWDQARAVMAVRPIAEARVFTPSGESARRLAARIAQAWPGVRAWAVATPGQALAGAEVVCCATTSLEPVFAPDELMPAAHVNGVGSFTPAMREVPVQGLLARPGGLGVFVDSLEMAWLEAGELIAARQAGALGADAPLEIGRVLEGSHPGRTAPGQTTFFKSVGLAAQDAAAGLAAFTRAQELGLGRVLDI